MNEEENRSINDLTVWIIFWGIITAIGFLLLHYVWRPI